MFFVGKKMEVKVVSTTLTTTLLFHIKNIDRERSREAKVAI
jgi:hypothetical protein